MQEFCESFSEKYGEKTNIFLKSFKILYVLTWQQQIKLECFAMLNQSKSRDIYKEIYKAIYNGNVWTKK